MAVAVMMTSCHGSRNPDAASFIKFQLEMHPCLALPDIIENIFSFVGCSSNECIPAFYQNINNRNTLAAATVCKAWLEPGLDELWHVQRSIVPLLRLLPEDCWEIRQPSNQIKTMCFLRPIKPDELFSPRILFYSRKIRALLITPNNVSYFTTVNAKGYRYLQSCMLDGNSRPLFPRLQELAYVPLSWNENIFVSEMAFVISLTGVPNISIPPPSSRTGRNNFPVDLPARQDPPILRRLHLNSSHPAFVEEHMRTPITLFNATHWTSLTHLRLWALLQPDTIMNIAAMPALEELHILLLQESLPSTTQNHDLFQYLRNLTIIVVENILPAAQFLHQFDPPVICLTINAPSLSLPRGIIDHLDQLGTGLKLPRIRSLLTTFKLSIQQRFNLANRVDESYRTVFMMSLLSLSGLESVEIDIDFGDYFGDLDTAILRMAPAWQRLTNLSLFTGGRRATLKRLPTLSSHCPHLISLTLPVNLSGEVPDDSVARSCERLNLEPIVLNFPRFQDVPLSRSKMIRITSFLVSTFPKLKHIRAPCFSVNDDPWFLDDGNPWDRALQYVLERNREQD